MHFLMCARLWPAGDHVFIMIIHIHYKQKDNITINSMDLPQMILLETGAPRVLARIQVRLSLPYNRQVAWDLEQFPLVAR